MWWWCDGRLLHLLFLLTFREAAAALQREMAKKVEASISQLDQKDCEIIVMRHYEHLTNQEIGQILELSEPAASMRYLRAIRRLKSVMQDGQQSIEP